MFGDDVLDEITSNILRTSGYPITVTFFMCMFIAIIPLTKIPLNARPIIATAEVFAGVHQPPAGDNELLSGRSYYHGFVRVIIRVLIILTFLGISILVPGFDSIMAFMGSALCFTICVM
jgi:solute carrier family 32 (vesicular inhibitory amino acid transporter)